MKWEQDLITDIRTGDSAADDNDHALDILRKYFVPIEVTDANRAAVTEQFLRVRDNCQSILEIGICRNDKDSFTHCFLNNKRDDTVYVGIDLDDKTFLNNPEKNIFTIQNTSSDVEANIERMKSFGVKQLDFIFIDGWHSINQVLIDWEYTKLLGPNGIIGFHDVNEHPGPYLFVRALDTDKWNVITDACPDDWGVGFAWKK
jgi:hypothetical protein